MGSFLTAKGVLRLAIFADLSSEFLGILRVVVIRLQLNHFSLWLIYKTPATHAEGWLEEASSTAPDARSTSASSPAST